MACTIRAAVQLLHHVVKFMIICQHSPGSIDIPHWLNTQTEWGYISNPQSYLSPQLLLSLVDYSYRKCNFQGFFQGHLSHYNSHSREQCRNWKQMTNGKHSKTKQRVYYHRMGSMGSLSGALRDVLLSKFPFPLTPRF